MLVRDTRRATICRMEGPGTMDDEIFEAAPYNVLFMAPAKRRIDLMLALPLEKLGYMAIHQHLKDIGTHRS